MVVAMTNAVGGFPSKYWHLGTFEGWERISAKALFERCQVRPTACLRCFMACGNLSEIKEGRHKGLKIEGPGYETIYAFVGLCMVHEIEEVAYLNDICDRLGMDTISTGNLCAFATSDRGACHLRSTFYRPELAGIIPPEQIDGKAKLFIDYEDRLNIQDALILCRFYRDLYLWDSLSKIIEMTTGLKKLDESGLRKLSSNIQNEIRRFNLREGITSKDDTLPKRFFDEPLGKEGKTIRRGDSQKMLQEYYALRGWSSEGIPEP